MSKLTITDGPDTEPVTLAEAQAHLRVDSDDDEDLISGLITAAREYCEQAQGRAYVTRAYQYVCDVASAVELPMPPCASVEGVAARSSAGVDTDLVEGTDYEVDTDGELGVVEVTSWPADTEHLVVEYTAGYGDAADVPQRMKQAVLMLIGHWYEQRETAGRSSAEVPFGVETLINMDRVNWGA